MELMTPIRSVNYWGKIRVALRSTIEVKGMLPLSLALLFPSQTHRGKGRLGEARGYGEGVGDVPFGQAHYGLGERLRFGIALDHVPPRVVVKLATR